MLGPRLTFARDVALILLPVSVAAAVIARSIDRGSSGFDLQVLLASAERIVAGDSPYSGLTYPPLIPFLLVPLTFVPAAATIGSIAALASVPVTLGALGVRDWRCYTAALLWGPVLSGIQTANATLFLVLAAALTWRYRERLVVPAGATGLAIAAKAISLPFALWLLGTGRLRAGVSAIAVAVGVTAALLGLIELVLDTEGASGVGAGISSVPEAANSPSYSPGDVVRALGGGTPAALAATGVVGAVALALVLVAARRGDDARSFSLAALSALVIAPNVWLHSFSFLLLVLGLARPRFSVLWLVPATFIFLPVVDPTWVDLAWVWLLTALLVAALLRRPRGVPVSLAPSTAPR